MQRKMHYQIGDDLVEVSVAREQEGYRVQVGASVYHIDARPREDGGLDLVAGSQRVRAYVATETIAGATEKHQYHVALSGQTWTLNKVDLQRHRPRTQSAPGAGALTATMPGLVLDVLVSPGAQVAKGESLVLLEAMKMELRITAPHDGTVRQVNCQAGEVVARGQKLIEIEQIS